MNAVRQDCNPRESFRFSSMAMFARWPVDTARWWCVPATIPWKWFATKGTPLMLTLAKRLFALFLVLSIGGQALAEDAAQPIRALLVTGGGWYDFKTQKKIITEGLTNLREHDPLAARIPQAPFRRVPRRRIPVACGHREIASSRTIERHREHREHRACDSLATRLQRRAAEGPQSQRSHLRDLSPLWFSVGSVLPLPIPISGSVNPASVVSPSRRPAVSR